MTLEQRVAVLEEIFLKLQDYYMSNYSGEEIDALLASAGVPIGITKEYDSVSAMNSDFSGTNVTRGQFVLILPSDTSSEDYGKVYLKGTANWVYVFTLTALTAIKGPQGPAGANGETGATGQPGKNFAVLGYYETLSALNAAVPSPEAGDTYGIGTEPPYAYYMYDPTISNWRYVGNLQGPAGSQGEKGDKGDTGATGPQGPEGPVGGASNFVRYDAAQSLTDAQKAQARANIAAAPSGFGLGGNSKLLTSDDDVNSIGASGWYTWVSNSVPANAIIVSNITIMRVDAYTPGVKVQTLYGATDGSDFITQPIVARRMVYGSKVGTWEYINPPMYLGVEYRTTERYLGKPVYVKVVDCGTIADGKQVAHGISNMGVCLSFMGVRAGEPMPQIYNHSLNDVWTFYVATVDKTNISLACGSSAAGANCQVTLKYIKTTD